MSNFESPRKRLLCAMSTMVLIVALIAACYFAVTPALAEEADDTADSANALTVESDAATAAGLSAENTPLTTQSSQTKGGVTVNATSITIYGLGAQDSGTLPSSYPTSFQIVVSGNTGTPHYSINQYDYEDCYYAPVKVSDSGLVTPSHYTNLCFYDTTCYITVTVDNQIFDIPCTYSVYYQSRTDADAIALPWYDANVSSNLSQYEKLQKITAKAGSYAYGTKSSTYEGLVLNGSGDCWSGARFVQRLCDYAGIECYVRNGNNDPWSGGSGHENAVAIIGGKYYIADGTPGFYMVTSGSYGYTDTGIYTSQKSDGTLKVLQYDGKSDTVTIPSTLGGCTVTEIDSDAFSPFCSYRSNLIKTINLPATVSTIDPAAIREMDNLEAINVDTASPYFKSVDGVLYTKDGSELVAYPLRRKAGTEEGRSYTVLDGTTTIRAYAFEGLPTQRDSSALETVILPNTVTSIGDNAFKDADIQYIQLPNSLKTVGAQAFYTSGLSALNLPASVTSVGTDAFNSNIIVNGMSTTLTAITYGTIYGHDGSAAQTFANANSKTFVSLDNGYVPLQSATPSQTSVTLDRGAHLHLNIAENPTNASIHASVTSSDELVASCSYAYSTGILYINAHNYGTAIITIYTPDGATSQVQVNVPNPYDLANATVSSIGAQALTGNPCCPVPTITCSIGTLQEGRDFTIKWDNNVARGTATATIRGAGSFTGERTVEFEIAPAPIRLSGNSALDTMVTIVKTGFSGTDGTVVLASLGGFADALTASGIAGLADAPVLLTDSTKLSTQTSAELARLKPSTIIVCGGVNSVSDAVASSAQSVAGATNLYRCAGANRTGTACEIYRNATAYTGASFSTTAFIATGQNFADALAIAPYAYFAHCPIFLSDGAASVSDETIATMKSGGITDFYILGGVNSVSEDVVDQLTAAGFTFDERLSGSNRYATSQAIATFELAHGMHADGCAVATGATYKDALTGAALCGKNHSVLLLAADGASVTIDDTVAPNKDSINTAYVFGGTASVSDATMGQFAAALV